MNPKAFICHASEDKDRFVLEFARRLREEKGIDAWLDQWEMRPGDSLVQKIFDEGLKNAQAVIVVVSKFSVAKRWCREELDVAMVRRINNESRLIPVIIDDCQIPECLKAILHERIADTKSYEKEFGAIVMTILNESSKPALGTIPRFATTILDRVHGLTDADALVLGLACEMKYETERTRLAASELLEKAKAFGLTPDDVRESLDILDRKHHISGTRVMRGGIPYFRVDSTAFDRFLSKKITAYDSLVRRVCLEIVNNGVHKSGDLAKAVNERVVVINHILDRIADRGLCHVYGDFQNKFVHHASPELKRILRDPHSTGL